MRLRVAGNVEVVAADADDHVILDDDGGGGRVVEVVHVADLLPPSLLSVLEVQRDEVAVGRLEVQPVLVHRHAAVPEMISARGRPLVVPQLASRTRIDRPHVIGNGEVQDAVDLQRRALDRAKSRTARRDPVHPGEAQLVDVGVGDRRERAEAAPRIVAVERRPAVGAGFEQLRRVEPALAEDRDGGAEDTRDNRGGKLEAGPGSLLREAGSWQLEAGSWKLAAGSFHFSASRYATTSCIALSVSRSSSSTWKANGSFLTIVTAGVRANDRYSPAAVAQRHVEIVERDERPRDGRAVGRRDRDRHGLPLRRAGAAAPPRCRGEHEPLLDLDRAVALAVPGQVPGGRVAGRAPALPGEVRLAGLRIAGQHVLDVVRRRALQRVVHALPDEMGQVGDLSGRQARARRARLHRVTLLQERADGAAVPIPEHERRSNEVRAAIRAACTRGVTRHAFGRIRLLPTFRRRVVDTVPVRRADVRPGPSSGRAPPRRPRHDNRLPSVVAGQVVEDGVELLGRDHRAARGLHRYDGSLPLRPRPAFRRDALDRVALDADAQEHFPGFEVLGGLRSGIRRPLRRPASQHRCDNQEPEEPAEPAAMLDGHQTDDNTECPQRQVGCHP